ncbi:MAG: helix-turn-helix domain-containing protein [Methanosarcinales archaeon]|nr:helix-turn-helix domain-containing protein [Methanosarcinales archaeon]
MVNTSKNTELLLAEKMAGQIAMSDSPGTMLKKWRVNFGITQTELANYMDISPSVISDYESGRRKSPGTTIVGKIVESIIAMDTQRGGHNIRGYETMLYDGFNMDVIYDTHEYTNPVKLADILKKLNVELVNESANIDKVVYGYTIVDSIKAILELSANEFHKLYGWSTERVMVFTKISTGRSPMVALKVTNLKPGAVILHGIATEDVDMIAKKIADIENVPLMATTMPLDDMIEALHQE